MISIRLAAPHEGSIVQALVRAGGGPAWSWLDWSSVYPYWLLGEVNGVPKGTIMVHPGVPFGRMEYLCIAPDVTFRHKALLCRNLSYAGIASCQQMGSQAVISNIDTTDGVWKRMAEKRGWTQVGEGSYLLKRCV